MKRKTLLEAKIIAKEAGFHDVRPQKRWKGFEVLQPIFSDGIVHYIGYPQYLLVKNGKIQWAKAARCAEIMEHQAKDRI